MKIKRKLCEPVGRLSDSVRDSYEDQCIQVAAPCRYFGAIVMNNKKSLKVSCVNCRAECMDFDEDGSVLIDCYTLMIFDFLKSCGVEVEDVH